MCLTIKSTQGSTYAHLAGNSILKKGGIKLLAKGILFGRDNKYLNYQQSDNGDILLTIEGLWEQSSITLKTKRDVDILIELLTSLKENMKKGGKSK